VSDAHSPDDRHRFCGEFHYFRVPRRSWADRLAQVRDLGFEGVSIYVPWNWHMPTTDEPDFTGRTRPGRDLLGVLDAIAAAGLNCIYRPGPFITAEWRHGGIPAWLWERDPSIVALDARDRVAGAGRPYPALTYGHPGYDGPAVQWLRDAIEVVRDHVASRGGPIVHLQLDDETSWWQQLRDPLALDYNPWLVAPDGERPSRYGRWLLDRYGSLDALNGAHRMAVASARDLVPPRSVIDDRADLPRHLDWLDFKLALIDEHIAVLGSAAREAGFDGPMSMLTPYLLPAGGARFAAFARDRMPDLELTNECYVSLFSATEASEQKLAHVIATHEAYHMWRGPGQGPAFSMELQGSNSSFISPGVMEMLYAVTLARGIRGFNVYMLVGGENPPGYELGTGRNYDVDAPIGIDGVERPHAAVLARVMRVIRAVEPGIMVAEPLRDTMIGCYVPYESAALVGADGAFVDAAAAMNGIFSWGDIGLSNVPSLTALLTLSGASWGMLDLERSDAEAWSGARQLWVPSLGFLSKVVQQRLIDWMEAGGHAVFLPSVPVRDDAAAPCELLARRILGDGPLPDQPPFTARPTGWTQVRTAAGGSLAVQGEVARYQPPADAEPLAWAEDGGVAGFRRPVGLGSATVLGFRLTYHPVGGRDQFAFTTGLVEAATGPLAATCDSLPAVALEMSGPDGGLLCVVDPVELPVSTRVTYMPPGTPGRATIPVRLPGIVFSRRGARLLPIDIDLGGGRRLRYATAELVERHVEGSGGTRLSFASAAGESFELAIDGDVGLVEMEGGSADAGIRLDGALVLVIQASASEVTVRVV